MSTLRREGLRPRGFGRAESEVGPLEVELNAYPDNIGIAPQWSKSLDDHMDAGMWMGKLGAPTPIQRATKYSSLLRSCADNSLLITLLVLSMQLHCSINHVTFVAGYVTAKIGSR